MELPLLLWHDRWLSGNLLGHTYPALFSHTLGPNISVQHAFQGGFDLHLRPVLTRAALCELDRLLSVLQDVHLQDGHDIRCMTATQKPFSTRDAYEALSPTPFVQDFHGSWIWKTRVPNKVKIFRWLYFKNRLSTKANHMYV